MVKAICINDESRPTQIPESEWVKKGEEYNIVWVYIIRNEKQNGIQGCDLAEITLDESNHPYLHFQLSRFAIEDIEALKQLASDCSGLDMSIIEELIKEEVC